jgi:hypothetical protein
MAPVSSCQRAGAYHPSHLRIVRRSRLSVKRISLLTENGEELAKTPDRNDLRFLFKKTTTPPFTGRERWGTRIGGRGFSP